MSLTTNIEQLKNNIQGTNSEGKKIKDSIQNSFFSDREIAKNIIKYKNPNLTEDAANIVVYGNKQKPVNEDNLESELTDIQNNNSKKYRYLSKNDQIFKEVSELKTNILNSSFIIGDKSSKLAIDVTNLSIMVINAIPGVAAYVLVGNIPGAINSLLSILNEVDKLKLHFNDLLPHIEIMSKLELVIPNDSTPYTIIEGLIAVLNTTFNTLNSLNVSAITDKLGSLKSQNTSSGTSVSSSSGNDTNSGAILTTTPKIINISFNYKDKNNVTIFLDITIVEKNTLQLKWRKPYVSGIVSYDNKYFNSNQIKSALSLDVDISSLEFVIDERDSSQRFLKVNDLQDTPNILYVLTKLNFTYPSY